MADGQYKFSIGLDDKQLELDIKKASSLFDKLVQEAKKAGLKIDDSIKNPFEKFTPPANLPQQTTEVAQSFNGLNFATQQIVRELPAATVGLNTFFLAISNNLPILADQIKNVNEQNKQLAAQGKPTTSALAQVGKSLLSWNTLLTVGVTLLTVYGKEIAGWVASLFRGKRALSAAEEAQKGLNEAIKEQGFSIGDDIVQLKNLQRAWIALGNDFNSRKKFIDENKSAFDDLGVSINTAAEADRLLVERTPEFVQAMKLRAQASAAQKLAEQKYEEAIIAENEANKLDKTIVTGSTPVYARTRTGVVQTGTKFNTTYNPERKKLEDEAKAAFDAADAYFNLAEAKNVEAASALKAAGISPTPVKDPPVGSPTKTPADDAERLKAMQANLAKDATEAYSDANIAAIEDAYEKEKALINKKYDDKEAEITKRENDLKELYKKLGKGDTLSAEDAANLETMRQANKKLREGELAEAEQTYQERLDAEAKANKELNDKRAKAWEDYLIKFGTYQEKLKATQDKYAREIAAAETDGEKKMLEAERDAALAVFEVQASTWAKELVGKSAEELNNMLKLLEQEIAAKEAAFAAMDSSDIGDAQALRKTINELNAKIAELRKQMGNASQTKENDWQGVGAGFDRIGQSIASLGDELEGLDSNIAKTVKNIGEITSVMGGLISAIGSGPLAIITVALEAVTKIINAIATTRAEYEALMTSARELNDELERTNRLAKVDSLKGTIFGEDAFGNFQNNLAVMRDAAEAFVESQDAIISRGKEITNAVVGFQELGIAIEQFSWDNITESLKQMQVLTKDRGKFAESWGFKDKYESLGDMLPDLFGDEGVTLEGLKSLQNSDIWDKLSEENRNLIDKMIDDWEAFEESSKAVTDYLTDIFGGLGNEINDAIVDAFVNGTDAAEAFGESASAVLENLIKQIGYTAYIAPILTQAMADVEALNGQGLSAEDYLESLMAIVRDTMGAAEQNIDGYNEFLERSDAMAEGMGIGTFNGERSAQAKGITQASQDSVDKLNGRMTAVQGHTYALMTGQRQLINDSAQMLRHLAGIEANTYELHQMRSDMSAMRKDISDIATRGIVTR